MRNYFKILGLIMVLALSGCGSGATSGDPLGTDTISNVSASVTSLSAGQSSVITATVKHADGRAATGRSVSFSITPNNSTGTITVTDDGKNNGVATAIYTAGASTPASSVQDTVKTSIDNGASAFVLITRAAVPGGGLVGGQIALFTASKLTVSAGQSSIMTANVTDGAGAPLSGVTVTFSLPTINSGVPTLSVASAVTDGTGNAITIYSPGTASPTISVEDNVQASLTNGSSRAVTITRSGNAAALANVISNISTSQTTLSAGQNSIVTATVTDVAGNPVSGQTVTFTLPIKGSGAPTLSPATATTDGRGNATTIYSPGTGSPTTSVEDMVQATITSGSTRTVSITRTGSSVSPTVTAVLAKLSASQSTLTTGQNSIITANVTDSAGSPVSGQTVTFTLPIKGSGAPTLSATSATTDGSGNATTIYSPGTGSPTKSVEDIVQASLTNSTRAVSITRSGDAATLANVISSLTPSLTPLSAGQNSTITATVKDTAGNPVSGVTVSFTIPAQNSGSPILSVASAVTDGSGNAIVIYSPGTASSTTSVDDIIQASLANGFTKLVTITRTAGASTAGQDSITSLSASLPTVSGGRLSVITAMVHSGATFGQVSNQTITFAIPVNNSGASFIDSSGASVATITIPMQLAYTSTDIPISATYKAGTNVSGTEVEDIVRATLGNASTSAIIITRTAATSTGTDFISDLSASLPTVSSGQMSVITAKVSTPLLTNSNQTITFAIPLNNSGASFIDSSGASVSTITIPMQISGFALTTDISTTYKAGTSGSGTQVEDIVRATLGNGSTRAIIMTRTASSNSSAFIITLGTIPALLTADNSNSVITANIRNNAGTAISNVTVYFAVNPRSSGTAGTLSVPSATTDASGNAVTTFTGAGAHPAGETDVVTASITVSGNTFTNAVVITYP